MHRQVRSDCHCASIAEKSKAASYLGPKRYEQQRSSEHDPCRHCARLPQCERSSLASFRSTLIAHVCHITFMSTTSYICSPHRSQGRGRDGSDDLQQHLQFSSAGASERGEVARMNDLHMDPTPPVRPILKTATKTGSRTRFLSDAASKYKSYSQSFHYTNYSASASRRSSTSSASRSSSSSRTASSSVSSSATGSASASFSESSMSSAVAAPSLSSASSSRERKRSDEIFLSPADRRVTFSQFTKIPRKPKSKKALAGAFPLSCRVCSHS